MPGFDRSGPQGRGPMTGWSRGLCSRTGAEGAFGPGGGRGRGFGGRGARRGLNQQQAVAFRTERFEGAAETVAENGAGPDGELASLRQQVQDATALLQEISEKMRRWK